MEVIKHFMSLHAQAGIIPDIKMDPEQALLILEKHNAILDGLQDYMRLSTDNQLSINLYTSENISLLVSFPIQVQNQNPKTILQR